ncbi:hypothetical protein V5E97_08570 [Singulisphaera sp. Ch08]|uniref:DDE-type integrase/transposase/recombinase n=1 Tax=Singulisphaera sp. Ch08 TaxID=3120278 RepID=A0AAU7CLR4_9BACT
MCLAAVLDWYSRYVIGWRLSNTLGGSFYLEMLGRRLEDRGLRGVQRGPRVQFAAEAFTGRLETAGVAVSMDGRGRALGNVLVERLWGAVEHERICIQGYKTVPELQ